jgi:hypothetical protein
MRPESSADDHWVTGDHFGLPIPAGPAALRAGGAAFLTRAFRVSGALTAGNVVTGITRFQEVPGGSTGRKLRLRVDSNRSYRRRLIAAATQAGSGGIRSAHVKNPQARGSTASQSGII